MNRFILIIIVFLGSLTLWSSLAAEGPDDSQAYWQTDPALQSAIKEGGASAVIRDIQTTIKQGAARLSSAEWQPTEVEAISLAQAMRWATIRHLKDQLGALDAIAKAPLGRAEPTLHYALTYNGRWAAWLIRTYELSPKQRVAGLIHTWRDKKTSIRARSFAEDRLIEDPNATDALVALTVKEVLPRAGTFKGKTLIISDVTATQELGRLETILAVKAKRSDKEKATIKKGIAGTVLEEILDLR